MAEEAVAGSPEGGGSPDTGSPEGSAQAGAETTSAPDWGTIKASLGDLGKDKALEPYKDLPGFVKSHIEAQKMIGNSVRLPGKDLAPEDRQKAVNDLTQRLTKEGILEGAPESADKYEIAMPQMEGWTPNEPLINSFKDAAHKAGIPNSKAQALFDWYINFQAETETQSQAEFETMKRQMKLELGGLYQRKMEAARRAVAKYLGVDGDEIISNLPPQVGRKLVLAFAEIGDPLLEDDLISGASIPGVESKEALGKKLEEMLGDKNHPLNDVSHPGHKTALEEYNKLNRAFVSMR